MRLFKKKAQHQDSFKQVIHRLSAMSESELVKVNQILDVVFDSKTPKLNLEEETTQPMPTESTLDETITEAKNALHTEQLEKRIEQFKQAKKPKNSNG